MGDAGAHADADQCGHDDVRPGEPLAPTAGSSTPLSSMQDAQLALLQLQTSWMLPTNMASLLCCHWILTHTVFGMLKGGSVDDVFSATHMYMKKREAK